MRSISITKKEEPLTVNRKLRTLFEVTENEIHSITLGKCMIRYRISGATTDPNITVAIRD